MPNIARWILSAFFLVGAAACDDDGIGPGAQGVGVELVAQGLTSPVALAEPPDGSGRLFIADQAGVVRVVAADGSLRPEPFLDVRDRMVSLRPGYDERGLLGLAFAPDYASSGRFFVYYTAPPRVNGYDNTSVISEFRVSADANVADAASEQVLLRVDQPQFNHEGGTLAFGPDGHLYVSIGDGGNKNDIGLGHVADWYDANEGGNGQDITQNLLGDILRLDVSTAGAYAIPADNPFVGTEGLDEIWAYGFRNPYRFSFDRGTGALLVGDAGQKLWEEVSVVERGGNYGWNVKEGTHCFNAADEMQIPEDCPSMDPVTGEPLVDPVLELLNHANPAAGEGEGIAVIVGGYVYRGDAVPGLTGRYVFGGFTTHEISEGPHGVIYVAHPGGAGLWPFEELTLANQPNGELGHFLLSFGEDLDGELYVLTTDNAGPTGTTGRVYRLITVPEG